MPKNKNVSRSQMLPILPLLIFAFLFAAIGVYPAYADKSIEEDNTSIISCLANCTGGFCLNTKVYLQFNTTPGWVDINYFTGNVLLNQSSGNPETLGTINTTVQVNFTVLGGNYSFDNQLRCNVTSDFSSSVSPTMLVNVTDTRAPNVTLLKPADNGARDPGLVNFTVSAVDKRLTNCTLYGNWSGTFSANETRDAVSGENVTYFNKSLDYGKYTWNAQCSDSAGNSAFAQANFTLNVAGDLSVNSSQVWFYPLEPSVSFNVTIFANVTNKANRSEQEVVVAFYEDDPDVSGIHLGNFTVNFTGFQTLTVNLSWDADAGLHNIFVVADPPFASGGGIIEFDESNNKANSSFLISMWQYYYGRINSTLLLYDSQNRSLIEWPLINMTGHIYASDTDTSASGISFASLKEMGRNSTGGSNSFTLNDFQETDNSSMLNTTQYPDSVNATFTSGGQPRQVMNFTVFSNVLGSVPVVNTTNSSNFITGILWDSDDSSNAYFDATDREDIVFVTGINFNQTGKYGNYDYEIRVPASLKSYKGATETITFYYELI